MKMTNFEFVRINLQTRACMEFNVANALVFIKI